MNSAPRSETGGFGSGLRRRARQLAWILVFVAPPLWTARAGAECGAITTMTFGGHGASGGGNSDNFATGAETVVNFSRPSPTAVDVSRIDFSYSSPEPSFSIRFLAVRPSGTTYTVVAKTADLVFHASAVSAAYSAALSPPLHFETGDLLGAVSRLTGTGQLMSTRGDDFGGYGLVRSTLDVGASVERDSFDFRFDSRGAAAMEAYAFMPCSSVPPFAVIVPVGDLVGRSDTHYRSDLNLLTFFTGAGGPLPVSATLRDELGVPGGVNTVQRDLSGVGTNSVFHADSVSSLLGLSSSFFGTLTLSFGSDRERLVGAVNFDNGVAATSTISAETAGCSGGQTGSTFSAVGCHGIGKRILLPFHVPPNHRLNIGVASTFLPACGAARPATAVTVRLVQPFEGTVVPVSMPGEFIQLNGVTASGSPIPEAIGLSDGVIEVRVTDESTRILAYQVVADNSSEDTAASYGLIVE